MLNFRRSRTGSTTMMVLFVMTVTSTGLMYYWFQRSRAMERQVAEWEEFRAGRRAAPPGQAAGWGKVAISELTTSATAAVANGPAVITPVGLTRPADVVREAKQLAAETEAKARATAEAAAKYAQTPLNQRLLEGVQQVTAGGNLLAVGTQSPSSPANGDASDVAETGNAPTTARGIATVSRAPSGNIPGQDPGPGAELAPMNSASAVNTIAAMGAGAVVGATAARAFGNASPAPLTRTAQPGASVAPATGIGAERQADSTAEVASAGAEPAATRRSSRSIRSVYDMEQQAAASAATSSARTANSASGQARPATASTTRASAPAPAAARTASATATPTWRNGTMAPAQSASSAPRPIAQQNYNYPNSGYTNQARPAQPQQRGNTLLNSLNPMRLFGGGSQNGARTR